MSARCHSKISLFIKYVLETSFCFAVKTILGSLFSILNVFSKTSKGNILFKLCPKNVPYLTKIFSVLKEKKVSIHNLSNTRVLMH